MRFRKRAGLSDAIARLRREEGWNYDKRKRSLTKNKIPTDYTALPSAPAR